MSNAFCQQKQNRAHLGKQSSRLPTHPDPPIPAHTLSWLSVSSPDPPQLEVYKRARELINTHRAGLFANISSPSLHGTNTLTTMRLTLIFVLFAATLSALCAPHGSPLSGAPDGILPEAHRGSPFGSAFGGAPQAIKFGHRRESGSPVSSRLSSSDVSFQPLVSILGAKEWCMRSCTRRENGNRSGEAALILMRDFGPVVLASHYLRTNTVEKLALVLSGQPNE